MDKEICIKVAEMLVDYIPRAAKGMTCNIIEVNRDGRVAGSLSYDEPITGKYSEILDKGFCDSVYKVAGEGVSFISLKVKSDGVGDLRYIEGTGDCAVEVPLKVKAIMEDPEKQFKMSAFLLSFSYFFAKGMWKIGLGLFVISALLPYWCYFVPSLVVNFYMYEKGLRGYSSSLRSTKFGWRMVGLLSMAVYVVIKVLWW